MSANERDEEYAALVEQLAKLDSRAAEDIWDKRLENAITGRWHWGRVLRVLPLLVADALIDAPSVDKEAKIKGAQQIGTVLEAVVRSGDRGTGKAALKEFFGKWEK